MCPDARRQLFTSKNKSDTNNNNDTDFHPEFCIMICFMFNFHVLNMY